MPQMNFPTTQKPLKIIDAGKGAFVLLQVLDANTLFFGRTLEEIQADGIATAGAAARSGFQLKAQAIPVPFVTWWEGEMWGRMDVANGLIMAAIVYQVKKTGSCKGGCSGGCSGDGDGLPQPGFSEGI
jgi:hypothetical protein